MGRYSDIIARLESASGPDRELDFAVARAAGLSVRNQSSSGSGTTMFVYDPKAAGGRFNGRIDSRFTASLDAALGLVERVLPGWLWRVASCSVSDDAWVVPDFNHPEHGPLLLREFGRVASDPVSYWQLMTDVDLRPSGRPAIALLVALFRALEAQEAGE